MNTTKVTDAGKIALLSVAASNAAGKTYVGRGPALLKLERDGLITKDTDGWWWLSADGMEHSIVISWAMSNKITEKDLDKVEITPVTLNSGVIVYRAACQHGWETGFHAEPNDASDVARGHGTVSRPLYESPKVAEYNVGDLVTDGTVTTPVIENDKGMVWIKPTPESFIGFDVEFPGKWKIVDTDPTYSGELPGIGQWIMWQGFSYMVEARYSDGRMNLKPYGGYVCVTPDRPMVQLMAWGEAKWPTHACNNCGPRLTAWCTKCYPCDTWGRRLIAPDVDDVARPFRTNGKVKSTHVTRSRRRG